MLATLLLAAVGCQASPSRESSADALWQRAVRFGKRLFGVSTAPPPRSFPALQLMAKEDLPPAMAGLQAEPTLSTYLLAGIQERRLQAATSPRSNEHDLHACASTAAVFSLPLPLSATHPDLGEESPYSYRVQATIETFAPSVTVSCWPDERGVMPAGTAACSSVGKEMGIWLWLDRPGRPTLELYFVPLMGSGYWLSPLEQALAAHASDRQLIVATGLACP